MPGRDPKIKEWYSGGELFEIVTGYEEGETDAEWCARHDSAVARAMRRHPED